jgi:hypothetical protein
MARHVLSLEAPQTLNEKILRLVDTSIYATEMPIECPILNITLPGFAYSVEMGEERIVPRFSNIFTACDLEIQTEGCGTTFKGLPDGVYVLKYSVSPNDVVFVEYNHLRVTKLLNLYQRQLCALDIADCAPSADAQKKMALLSEIKTYIDAAVAKVEICHDPKKGMQLYTYAKKLLTKFDC